MTLNRLQNDEYWLKLERAWHLCYYLRNHDDNTVLTAKILEFKDGNKKTVTIWCQWAVDELTNSGVEFDLVVRALGSTELVPGGNKPLDELGRCLEAALGTNYKPIVLRKTRLTKPLHTLFSLPERKKEIGNIYVVNNTSVNYNRKNILIIDDITTSNVTIGEILRALKVQWPKAKYYLFCLGKTSTEKNINANIDQNYF